MESFITEGQITRHFLHPNEFRQDIRDRMSQEDLQAQIAAHNRVKVQFTGTIEFLDRHNEQYFRDNRLEIYRAIQASFPTLNFSTYTPQQGLTPVESLHSNNGWAGPGRTSRLTYRINFVHNPLDITLQSAEFVMEQPYSKDERDVKKLLDFGKAHAIPQIETLYKELRDLLIFITRTLSKPEMFWLAASASELTRNPPGRTSLGDLPEDVLRAVIKPMLQQPPRIRPYEPDEYN